jgi:hypothetical protein
MLLVLRRIWGVQILGSICRLLVLVEGRLTRGVLLVGGRWLRSRVESELISGSHRPPGIIHELIIVDLPLLQVVLRNIALHLR